MNIPDGRNAAELEKYLREHPPQVRVSPTQTDSDIAAYRGLSNGAQEVEIGMAEVVPGNAKTGTGQQRVHFEL